MSEFVYQSILRQNSAGPHMARISDAKIYTGTSINVTRLLEQMMGEKKSRGVTVEMSHRLMIIFLGQ